MNKLIVQAQQCNVFDTKKIHKQSLKIIRNKK